jgi:pyruvate-formate lyase-activating enzyme
LDKESAQTKNRPLSVDEVAPYLRPLPFKRAIFLGKEPTCDGDFLSLAEFLKERFDAYNILLTNGYKYVNPLIGGKVKNRVIDEVCISIKAVSKKIFRDFTGKSNPEQVLANFRRYAHISRLKLRAESIFIPDYIDGYEIEKIVRFIASVDDTIPYRIDGYIPSSTYFLKKPDRFRRPTEGEMKAAKKIAQKYLKNVSILHSGVKPKYRVKRIY